ncbi:MAG: hypothetical protein KDA52_14175 [Planctomycetaceae bacterium]|nr:hypothetical protein [Planctomycetaceae bacterium]
MIVFDVEEAERRIAAIDDPVRRLSCSQSLADWKLMTAKMNNLLREVGEVEVSLTDEEQAEFDSIAEHNSKAIDDLTRTPPD